MYLTSIYISPDSPFDKVEFKNGLNIIYGEKIDKKKRVNWIWKSTFFDLIDFALLSNFDKSWRLYVAYERWILKWKSVVLECTINNIAYIITRWFDIPSKVLFKINWIEKEFWIQDARDFLWEEIFYSSKYEGKYIDKLSYRTLMQFYVKVDKNNKKIWKDPVLYSEYQTRCQSIPYHLFLLNINNELAIDNNDLVEHRKDITEVKKKLSTYLKHRYWENFLWWANGELSVMQKQILDISESLGNFQLIWTYESLDDELNILTEKIKDLWLLLKSKEQELSLLESAISSHESSINTSQIERIYSETNELLWNNIKLTLKEAIKFRKDIIKSRKIFLKNKIEDLRVEITSWKELINSFEEKRTLIYKTLYSNNWVNDLITGYKRLNDLQIRLTELEWKVGSYNEIQSEVVKIQKEEIELNQKLLDFNNTIQLQIKDFQDIIENIHFYLYQKESNGVFGININLDKVEKFDISIAPTPSRHSKWIIRWIIALYDLSILIYRATNNLTWPRFLCHDGIFDWVDKSQEAGIFKYIQEQDKKWLRFQYIISINDEWIQWEKFWDEESAKLIEEDWIKSNTILYLTEDKKLLWDFSL